MGAGYDYRADEQRIRQLTEDLRRVTAERDRLVGLHGAAERAADRYRAQAAAAQVDADRRIRQAHGHLGRVLSELLRRQVATDLVPDWWRQLDPDEAADAEMRAGWPAEVALADRCRQLEEALHAAQGREDEAVRRRRAADDARDEWIEVAVAAGAVMGHTRELVTIPARERSRRRSEEFWRDRAGEWELRALAAEETVRLLSALLRRLTRLPVAPRRLPAEGCLMELYALADVVAPVHGPCGLPADVVAEVCLLAAEYRAADIVSMAAVEGRKPDSEVVRQRVMDGYGYPARAEPGPAAGGQGKLFEAAP